MGVISMGQAKPLISIEDSQTQMDIYHRILDLQLSSREIEALVKKGTSFEAQADELELYKEDMRIEVLTLKGKTKVLIDIQIQDLNKGNIRIKFSSEEELAGVLAALS